MNDIYIEDSLHFIQGVDKPIKLKSVECLAVNQTIDYIENKKTGSGASSTLTVTSSIVLDYEIGVDVQLTMDAVYKVCGDDSKKTIQELLAAAVFELRALKEARPSENILFIIKNDAVLEQLKIMYKKPSELSYREGLAMFVNDDIAARFIEEYRMGLALNPHRMSDFFDEGMRIDIYRKIAEKACEAVGK